MGMFLARASLFFLPLYFLVVGALANFSIASTMVTGPDLAYVFAIVLIIGTGLLVISRFDLTREHYGEIRAQLRETRDQRNRVSR